MKVLNILFLKNFILKFLLNNIIIYYEFEKLINQI